MFGLDKFFLGTLFGACILAMAGCTPSQINAAATLNCSLASDGVTVVAIAKPGYATLANTGAQVGCAAGQQIGAALATKKP